MANSIIETITPEKAQVYLNMSGGNRNISQVVVDRYAKAMGSGNWKLNGDSIRFDVNRILIDGHHRLYACIKAGVPFQTFVTRGLEKGVFDTIDNGRHRNVGQLLSILGVKNYNVVSSSMIVFDKLVNNKHNVGIKDGYTRKTNDEMISIFKADPEGFEETGLFAVYYSHRARLLHASIIGGTYYYLTRVGHYNKELVSIFFDELINLDPSEIVAIDTLRRRLWKNIQSQTKLPANIVFAFLIKTWNAYVTGKTITKISFVPEKENYPQFILNNNN